MTRRGIVASATALLAGACSPLAMFNQFSPKDPGAGLVRRDIAFGTDPRQKLDLYGPRAPVPGGAPVLVFFYGGSWDSGDKALYAWAARAFAARGFLTAVPNYRLVPHVQFPDFVQDGAAAFAKVRAVAGEFGGDPDRMLLAGHSAGAYIALMLALDPEFLGAAEGLRGAAGLSGPYDFYPFDAGASKAAFGQAADPVLTQPIHFARGDAPPLFLGHGDADTLVYPRNSLRLGEAVRAKGGQAEVRIYPGLDHADVLLALSRPLRRKGPVLTDVVDFLHRSSGGDRAAA